MTKTIWFDMDGTLYDLYKIPGWLPMLETRQWGRAFGQDDYARAHIDRIDNAIEALKRLGWKVGVLTWAPKDVKSNSLDFDRVHNVKWLWLSKNVPSLAMDDAAFACLPYGESKAQFIIDMEEVGDVNYLVDDNKEVRRDWREHWCQAWDFKTINASRAFYRELEGLAM